MVWNSVTPIHFTKVTIDPEFTISGCVVNGLATVYCRWVNKGPFFSKAWTGVTLASMDVRAVSEGFNMFVDNSGADRAQDRYLYVRGNTVFFRTSYDANIPGNVWHVVGSVSFPLPANLTLPLIVTMHPTRHRVSLLFVYGGFHCWVTESLTA